ncbi:retrovirus-related pol polyprotein from transposon TNT 1-94, partial [Tanacetum coccineum]
NPERLKKAIAAQPKMYDGDMLHSEKLIINSTNSEETLEDAEESRNKMKNKMIQANYDKINALYETFVSQQEISAEQTYFSIPSISNHSFESKYVPPESPVLKMLNESRFKLRTIKKGNNVNTKFDSSETFRKCVCVTPCNKQIEHNAMNASNTKVNSDRSKPVTSQSTPKPEQGQNTMRMSLHKCIARHALSRKSSVKRALFTSPLAAKSKNLGATFVVTISRLSVAKTPTATRKVIQLVLWIVDSGCSKHMTGNLQLLRNFIEKFIGTVRFGNDHFAAITGYGDYVQGNLTICHVYYVEGLGHNLFSVGQFCDGDLEVAFRSNTCYVRNLEGDDLLTGSRDSNLYTISISEMAASSPVCLMSRATSTKSWLWHRRLSHLNFGTINQLTSNDLVDGLPKLKYTKDHLCSACEQGKSKKASLPPKLVPSIESKLELLHMDLCGPMRVASINGKKYILMIVDDYSRYTWVYFLCTKDEAPDMIIDFVNQV